jgi:hypothetical protein
MGMNHLVVVREHTWSYHTSELYSVEFNSIQGGLIAIV